MDRSGGGGRECVCVIYYSLCFSTLTLKCNVCGVTWRSCCLESLVYVVCYVIVVEFRVSTYTLYILFVLDRLGILCVINRW